MILGPSFLPSSRAFMAAGIFSLGLLGAAVPALAQSSAAVAIDLPAQPLGEALVELAEQAGVTIVAPEALVAGKSAPAVSGRLAAEEAVRRLLLGSGLTSRSGEGGAIIVTTAPLDQQGSEPIRLAPITVTGERVERTVFGTASSVAVTGSEELERNPGIGSVRDVLDRIPNVNVAGQQNQAPAIRGVDTTGPLSSEDAFAGGALPRSTITVDGRPTSFNEYVFGQTAVFDLERVEVFRGPQTTSQGDNSIAGAIYVHTKDPTFTPEIEAQSQITNFNGRQLAAVVSGPIVDDELAARIAFDYQERESFVDFPTTIDFGGDPQDFEASTLRAKLLWEPEAIPELSTKLTLSRTSSESPQGEFVAPPFSELDALNPNQSVMRTRATSAIHDVSFELTDSLELTNQFSYTGIKFERLAPAGFGVADVDTSDFANESTLKYDGGRLSGLVGSYLRRTSSDEFIDLTAFLGNGDFDDTKTSLGLFGEGTYDLTERLDVTLGLRYQRNRQDRDGTLGPLSLEFDETFDALLPRVSVGYDVTDDLRVGALVSRGFNPGGTTINFFTGEQDTFGEETLWNYEAFLRARLLNGKLDVNANIFFADYQDFQTFSFIGFDPFGDPEFEIDNADQAYSYGLEVSADYLVNEDLRLFGALGLLNTELVEFSSSQDPNIEGNELAFAPNVTFSAGVDYELLEGLTLGSRVRFSDSYFSDQSNDFETDSYVVADFFVSYSYHGVEATAFVNNAFDRFYVLNDFGTGASVGTPRVFGGRLKVSF